MTTHWQGRPVWAEIDLEAVASNVRALKGWLGPGTEFLAVVKANAYGHGALPIAETVLEAGATRLGVACADEGVQLRQAGFRAPILMLGTLLPAEGEKAVAYGLTPTLSNQESALAVAAAAHRRGQRLPVHVKVDTGMSRLGLTPPDAVALLRFLLTLPSLEVEGLYTHFATADEPDKSFTWEQYRRFLWVAEQFPQIPLWHVANSAAILDLPELKLGMVRAGISLYGLYPSAAVSRSVALRPALSLKARVSRLQWLAPGDSVSYGRTWVAERPTCIALVPCGYADGLRRGLSNRGSVLVRGQRAPILGRVCMDQCMVGVTHIPEVELGDEVVLIGRQGEAQISVEEMAALENTINYEIVCGITARVPRVYLRGGQIVRVQTLTEIPALAETIPGPTS